MTNRVLVPQYAWRVSELIDWTAPASGSTDTGKVWVWNHATSKYEAATTLTNYTLVTPTIASTGWANANHAHIGNTSGGQLDHGSALTGLGDNDHPQYFLASGISGFGATLIDDADAAAGRETLGLGTMATATETSYLLTTGSRGGATSSRQSFALGISVPTQTGLILIGSYGTVSETAGGLGYITGNALKASQIANNSVVKTSSDAGQFMRMRYDSGISFHTNLTGASGTEYSDLANIRMVIDLDGYVGVGHSGGTSNTALLDLAASTSTRSSLRIRPGAAVSSPNDGELWYLSADRIKFRRSSTTETIASGVTSSGAAATAGASYTGTEQAMLQAVYNAARSFGLLA